LPLLYTGKWFWAGSVGVGVDSAEAASYPLWHAQYPSTRRDTRPYRDAVAGLPADPAIALPWESRGLKEAIWQFDGDGGLYLPNGVDVDVNRMRGTLHDFVASTRVGEPPKRRRVDDARELQRALVALDFDPGKIDGIAGPNTRAALSRFASSRVLSGSPADVVLDQLELEYVALTALALPADPRLAPGELPPIDASDVINTLFPKTIANDWGGET